MPNGEKPTEDEHFIPRLYLRGFSEIKNIKKKNEKALIWQFNLKTMQRIPVQVDVKDICFEKNLYELESDDGSIIAQNTIEKTFGKIEAQVSRVIQSIIEKSQNTNCINCPTVLSDDDKSYLVIFINSLLYRDPKTIEKGIKYLQEANSGINTREARNITLLNLLPLGLNPEWDKNTIIRSANESLSGMAFQIGVIDDDLIITSDRPSIIWPPKENELYNRPRAVAFPLTSRLVLYLFPIESVDPIARNCFIKQTNEQVNDLCRYISVYARDWIFSRNLLTDEQIEIIVETRGKLQRNSMN